MSITREKVQKNISANLKIAREKSNLSLRDVADITGIDHSSISLWEAGKRVPGADYLALLAEAYKVSMDWMVGLK